MWIFFENGCDFPFFHIHWSAWVTGVGVMGYPLIELILESGNWEFSDTKKIQVIEFTKLLLSLGNQDFLASD